MNPSIKLLCVAAGIALAGCSHPAQSLEPSGKHVFGWHPWWMGTTYERYDYSKIDTIAYFSYEVDPATGNPLDMHDWATTPLVAWAHSNGVKVVLTATLFGEAQNNQFLNNPASCDNLIHQLAVAVSNRGADGVNVDFELLGPGVRTQLTAFMSNLTARFRRDLPGAVVSIDLPAVDWNNAFDAAAMDAFLDYQIVMGYDFHWSTAPQAGPVAPLRASAVWGAYGVERSIDDYLALGVRPAALFLGCPHYGYDWPVASSTVPANVVGVGTPINYADAKVAAATHGRRWDAASLSPYYVYSSGGATRQVWYDDAESLGLKYDLAKAKGIGGIAIWALGFDDPHRELWDLIGQKFASPLWDDGHADLGAGWRRLEWFGDYVPMGTEGWIWHNRHGFFFVAPNSVPDSVWLYAMDMGWLWTGPETYPFLFRASDNAWLWYNGAVQPRWFLNMQTSQWENRP
jgi:spore germination protein